MIAEFLPDRAFKSPIMLEIERRKPIRFAHEFNSAFEDCKALKDIVFKAVDKSNAFPTYTLNGSYQCSPAQRSMGDIYRIVKYYYKEKVSIKDIYYALMELILEYKIESIFCIDINKQVFYSPHYTDKEIKHLRNFERNYIHSRRNRKKELINLSAYTSNVFFRNELDLPLIKTSTQVRVITDNPEIFPENIREYYQNVNYDN